MASPDPSFNPPSAAVGLPSRARTTLKTVERLRSLPLLAHERRVGAISRGIVRWMGLQEAFGSIVELAAPLHDVGKLAISDTIVDKPGKLTQDEIIVMRRHAQFGAEILREINDPVAEMAASIAECHHECWDGTGYPRGLKGDEIPVEARIVAVSDVYDALRTIRPYKPQTTHDEAFRTIMEGDHRTKPTMFDPPILVALKTHAGELASLYAELPQSLEH